MVEAEAKWRAGSWTAFQMIWRLALQRRNVDSAWVTWAEHMHFYQGSTGKFKGHEVRWVGAEGFRGKVAMPSVERTLWPSSVLKLEFLFIKNYYWDFSRNVCLTSQTKAYPLRNGLCYSSASGKSSIRAEMILFTMALSKHLSNHWNQIG